MPPVQVKALVPEHEVRPAPVKREATLKLVVVELVVVELRPVKFCRVDEPVTRRFERVVKPEVTPSVPGKV